MPVSRIALLDGGRACLLLFLLATASGAAPRLFNLGVTADVNAVTVLADGTAILAGSGAVTGRPGVWTITPSSNVTTDLLTGPAGAVRYGTANAISADGNYIAGMLYKTGAVMPFQTDGVVWTRAQPTNPTIVPDLSDPFPSTTLNGVSNTNVAVGVSSQFAYTWNTSSGGTALPTVDSSAAWANGISADGTVIVGTALDDVSGHPVAVRWSSGQYGVLNTGYSIANAVSPNGQLVAGAVDLVDDEFFELDAVYWDNGQLQELHDLVTWLPLEGQASWVTDAGIVGGYTGPPGEAPIDAWIYFLGTGGVISFETWWRQITDDDFPVDVTTISAAAERDGQLYVAVNGGSWFAIVDWAAPGDGNRDRVVDGADYTIWADNYLSSSATKFEQGDFSGDDQVDGADYTIWADAYDPYPAALAVATPEPATLVLFAAGAPLVLVLILGRIRKRIAA